MKTVFSLPFPPSNNNLFPTNKKTGHRFPSDRYQSWKAEAAAEQYRQRPKPIKGLVHVLIELCDKPDQIIRDGDNFTKAILDHCVFFGLIEDDNRRFVRELTVRWDAEVPEARVTITPWPEYALSIKPLEAA